MSGNERGPLAEPERHLPLEGATNFRDFGGYSTADGRKVKWRILYRSDRLSDLTEADFERLNARGIRIVFDLRRQAETLNAPTRWLGAVAPEIVHLPLFGPPVEPDALARLTADQSAERTAEQSRAAMNDLYVRLVTEPTPLAAYGQLFDRLGHPGACPALFHCAGGKDRTGVACALILSALGVSRADIIADFMLTQHYYDAHANRANRVAQAIANAGWESWGEAALAPIFRVEPYYIETALDLVQQAGGIEPFLCSKAGLSPAALERVRAACLASPE